MPLVKYPDPRLRVVSRPIPECENVSLDLIGEIYWWMKHPHVQSISAAQLGYSVRVIAIRWGPEQFILINPEIVNHSDQTFSSIEGCLSFPGDVFYGMTRWKQVKVTGKLLWGVRGGDIPPYKSLTANGLDAASFQHEIDHLDGKLISRGLATERRRFGSRQRRREEHG
ncbi:hypothetical protein LCGC14_1272670 [marine sediment metagenome]|uniref:Peptide deformylase n=1 Tax=marine sediment metagenome TaxID=412755 RepID=A0A0F9KXM6_9ZZZZ